MKRLACTLGVLLVSTACGDDSGGGTVDAPRPPDGSGGTIDAPGSTIDAPISNVDGLPTPADGGMGTPCGGDLCTADVEECCVQMMGMTTEFNCIPAGDPCNGGTVTGCDGPEDCGGGHCCGAPTGGAGSQCSTDPCEAVELCHAPTDCSEAGANCCALPIGTGYCSMETCPTF